MRCSCVWRGSSIVVVVVAVVSCCIPSTQAQGSDHEIEALKKQVAELIRLNTSPTETDRRARKEDWHAAEPRRGRRRARGRSRSGESSRR